MKKHSLPIVIFLLSLLLTLSSASAADPFIVSGNPKAPPVVWEQYQELVGLGPDITREIFKELGISYTIRGFGNWKNVQTKAKAGQIDMLVSVYRNTEREDYLSFSIPYLSQPTVILVEKGKEFKFSSWDSLIGKKGVSNIGESYGQKFDDFIRQKLDVSYSEFERAIQLLNLGEADYLVVDLYTALIYARLLRGEDAITILDPPVTVQNFHLAVRKDSPLAARLPEINEKLKERIANGEIKKTLMHHFDNWQKLSDQRAGYFNKDKSERSAQQKSYLKEQDEMARQRIMGTMVNREGLPPAAE